MTLRGGLVGLNIEEPAGQLHVKGNDTTDQIIIENTTNSSTTAPDLVLYKSGTIGVDIVSVELTSEVEMLMMMLTLPTQVSLLRLLVQQT